MNKLSFEKRSTSWQTLTARLLCSYLMQSFLCQDFQRKVLTKQFNCTRSLTYNLESKVLFISLFMIKYLLLILIYFQIIDQDSFSKMPNPPPKPIKCVRKVSVFFYLLPSPEFTMELQILYYLSTVIQRGIILV